MPQGAVSLHSEAAPHPEDPGVGAILANKAPIGHFQYWTKKGKEEAICPQVDVVPKV